MLKPDPSCPMSSAEKKRLRDRRAQQNLRNKKLRHTTQLEEKVAYCEKHHQDGGVERLLQVIESLRRQNESLVSRQRQLSRLVQSWDVESPEIAATTPTVGGQSIALEKHNEAPETLKHDEERMSPSLIQQERSVITSLGRMAVNGSPSTSSTAKSPRSESQPPESTRPPVPSVAITIEKPITIMYPPASPVESVPTLTETYPPWKLIPLNDDGWSRPTSVPHILFTHPERIAASPDTPSSPLDILYGSKTNPLAEMIHTVIRKRPLRDPECLAIGWTVYHMTKWLYSPSPATYARIPGYFRPVLGQCDTPHPVILDFIPFPQVRLNVIKRWDFYKSRRDDLFGLFTCCVKVRWPWGEQVLERNEENNLCIRQDFYDTFMNESGWGITPEFIRRYPDLMAGVDLGAIIYEIM